jgi:hypothetical protein
MRTETTYASRFAIRIGASKQFEAPPDVVSTLKVDVSEPHDESPESR